MMVNDQYGRRIVDQSLSVWSALNKAVEREFFSILVMRVKSPSEAWKLLRNTDESDESITAKENPGRTSSYSQ